MDKIVTKIDFLRQKSLPVTKEEIERLGLKDKIKTSLKEDGWCRGLGLAAIQIGFPLRYAWYMYKGREHELVNPKILTSDRFILFQKEGCLSIPNVYTDTIRAADITFENDGQVCSAEGLEACIIQHEIDHMDGILVFSRAQNPYPELGRNDICCCGSGKKYKKCCLK